MNLTTELLELCTGASRALAEAAVGPANNALRLYDQTTANRVGMFLANVGHETGGLQWKQELWGPTDAQRRYEGRTDLGNTEPGDGSRFRGRGWLQTTGRGNYAKLTSRLRMRWPQMQVPDFVSQPELLASPEWCALSAVDFVEMNRVYRFADSDNFDNYCDMVNLGHPTQRVGDTNGWPHRLTLWQSAKPALLLAGFPA